MARTYWDIKAKVWSLLGQKSTSTNFSPSIVGNAINSRILDFLRWRITSLVESNRVYATGKLWIREGSTYFRTISSSSLSQSLAVWSTTIYCPNANLLSSGWVDVWGETLSYASKTVLPSTETLNWTSANQVLHESWTIVRQLYTMSANFEKPIGVFLIDETNGVIIQEIPLKKNIYDKFIVYYEIEKIWSASIIRVIWLNSNSLIEIRYSSIYTDMVNDSDICVIPDHYGETVIAQLVAGELGLEKWMPNSQNILIKAYANLQNCYQYFNSESDKPLNRIKPISYWFNSLRRTWRITR